MLDQFEGAKFAAVTLTPKVDLKAIQEITARVVGSFGCPGCGRVARFRVDFVGDPPAELKLDPNHVASFEHAGVKIR